MSAPQSPPRSAEASPWLQQAQAQGLLPAGAALPALDARPWPVLALTALGAWFVAVPLLLFVAGLFSGLLREGLPMAAVGVGLLVPAVLLLRDERQGLFVEQLALPLLLAGALALGVGVSDAVGTRRIALLLGALALALAGVLPRTWLRALLGLAFGVAWWVQAGVWGWLGPEALLPPLVLTALWAGALLRGPTRASRGIEATGTGAMVAMVLGLAFSGGAPWLVAGLLPGTGTGAGRGATSGAVVVGVLSVVVALAGLAWRHPVLRGRPGALLGGLAVAAASVVPAVGVLGLIAATAWSVGRVRVALVAALAALGVVGSFYYQLHWPLLHKAGVLAGLAAALGLWALAHRAPTPGVPRASAVAARWPVVALLLAGGLTVAVAQVAIAHKERLIAEGQPLFVRLAPVDPRSLMQGDYMALRFELPAALAQAPRGGGAARPLLRVRVDAQQRALAWRPDDGSALAPDERRVELSPKNGQWVLVTDAWFFAEGEAARWQAARWGEFRVEPDGRALLVGLRGEQLQAL